MPETDHRKIAAECETAAAAAKSPGDREQLRQIQQKHLKLAQLQEAGLVETDRN